MGKVLMFVGLAWAAMGVMNIYGGVAFSGQSSGISEAGGPVMFAMTRMILPGLALAALGLMIRRESGRNTTD